MPAVRQHTEPRTIALVAGLLAAAALCLFSLRALINAEDLQDHLNREHALDLAQRTLVGLVARGDGAAVAEHVRYLVRESDLGLTYLAVADTGGSVLAVDGRFERLVVPLLSTLARQKLRRWLYRFTSEHGRLRRQMLTRYGKALDLGDVG